MNKHPGYSRVFVPFFGRSKGFLNYGCAFVRNDILYAFAGMKQTQKTVFGVWMW